MARNQNDLDDGATSMMDRVFLTETEQQEREMNAVQALRLLVRANYPTTTLTIATIDSEIGRKLGMEKGKRYVIALIGEA